MKNLSIREFSEVCRTRGLTRFILTSDNQSNYLINNTLKLDLIFDVALVAFNPNVICLKNANGLVCFERVKHIRMKTDSSPLGIKFTIICGDFSSNNNDISYTIFGN